MLVPTWQKAELGILLQAEEGSLLQAELGALLQAEEGGVWFSFPSGRVVQHLAALLRANPSLAGCGSPKECWIKGGMGFSPGDTAVNVCVEKTEHQSLSCGNLEVHH